MLAREEFLLIIYFIVVILVLTTFGILFFVTFQRRKNKMLYEKFEAEKRYEQEIAQSRIEIQEQTLKNVGWELHDNIGQLLSVANMQLNMLARTSGDDMLTSVTDIKEIVANSLQEVRSLSKSLNNEVVDYAGLEESVRNELTRFERLNIIETSIETTGEPYPIPSRDTIILFQNLAGVLFQCYKAFKSRSFKVEFHYTPQEVNIIARDNGVGFDIKEAQKSSGLINMESRAKLIGAGFKLKSSPEKGTYLSLQYQPKPD
jgi:signal transduction histidine kinase